MVFLADVPGPGRFPGPAGTTVGGPRPGSRGRRRGRPQRLWVHRRTTRLGGRRLSRRPCRAGRSRETGAVCTDPQRRWAAVGVTAYWDPRYWPDGSQPPAGLCALDIPRAGRGRPAPRLRRVLGHRHRVASHQGRWVTDWRVRGSIPDPWRPSLTGIMRPGFSIAGPGSSPSAMCWRKE
jgi:hypothetical protein